MGIIKDANKVTQKVRWTPSDKKQSHRHINDGGEMGKLKGQGEKKWRNERWMVRN